MTQIKPGTPPLDDVTHAASQNGDWFLQTIVRMVNTTALRVPVTLTLGGGLVSGDLISGKEYFAAIGDMFATAPAADGNQIGAQLASHFAGHGETVYGPTENNTDQAGMTRHAFIHLKNARFVDNAGAIPDAGLLWRGRIDEVIGFSLGSVRTSPKSDG
ncbi:hypothetical protein IGB42_02731 [Andreprevotia sp. IGB-42]|uniref:gas vesicle accessory protein GvpU n=1 Tax=Andreprevotia sp. IGB-42 TaxID=2497473 RepID=UPI001358DFE3|nr:gas vesicle accessory protein GvpU [Andreprevotia sp. IGB-42]KAF0812887.1 hypothetical protein IGB42_02731 [Andreprevotia sp. IGB-42]